MSLTASGDCPSCFLIIASSAVVAVAGGAGTGRAAMAGTQLSCSPGCLWAHTARLLLDPASLGRGKERAQTLGTRVPASLLGHPLLPQCKL